MAWQFLSTDWPKGKPFSATVQDKERNAFRMMVPGYYTQPCLACHGEPKGQLDVTGYPKEGGKLLMMPKRKDAKAKKSILETLLGDMQGTAAEGLALFEKLRAAGAFVNEPVTALGEAVKMLHASAAMERGQ